MISLRSTLKRKGIHLESRGIMYGFRHGVATELLVAEVPAAHVASILGHKSTVMLFKHYSHLADNHGVLKTALANIKPVDGESTTAGASVQQ